MATASDPRAVHSLNSVGGASASTASSTDETPLVAEVGTAAGLDFITAELAKLDEGAQKTLPLSLDPKLDFTLVFLCLL